MPVSKGGVPTGPVTDVARLRSRPGYERHMAAVRAALDRGAPAAVIGALEDHPEYRLTVESNKLLAELREEAETVRDYTAALYARRFPDLSDIVSDALLFARTVRIVRDTPPEHIPALATTLETVLPGPTVMMVTVAGSALDASPLTGDELARLDGSCAEAEALSADRATVLAFVETRMGFLAPNTSALLGPRLASELVGMAGGLTALSRIPACNVQVMGRSKASTNGLSRVSIRAHDGIVHTAELVRAAAPSLRQRTAKVLAAKAVLCSRIDAFRSAPDGSAGAKFAEEIREKVRKWEEPPAVKSVKPLPIPEPKKSRKRGGKRYQRIKEKYGMTEVRKAANRLAVDQGGTEYGESAMGNDGGMLGMGGSGRLRVAAKQQKNLMRTAALRKAKPRAPAAEDPLSGLKSTISFSHNSGMELINPDAAKARRERAAATSGYFDDDAGFRGAKAKKAE